MADISAIYLLDPATGEAIEAELFDSIQQIQLDDWANHWIPANAALIQKLSRERVPPSEWPQSLHWDWAKKTNRVQNLLAFRGFSVVAKNVTQGMMQVNLNATARVPGQIGKPLVYIDYLEVAPWNAPYFGKSPKMRGVGSALLTAAIALSYEEGFKGRIGLHSLPQADNFYMRSGMTELGRDATYQNLKYFEMNTEQARAFLEEE